MKKACYGMMCYYTFVIDQADIMMMCGAHSISGRFIHSEGIALNHDYGLLIQQKCLLLYSPCCFVIAGTKRGFVRNHYNNTGRTMYKTTCPFISKVRLTFDSSKAYIYSSSLQVVQTDRYK